MKKVLFFLLVASTLISCGDAKKELLKEAFNGFRGNYIIYVDKKNFALYVYDRNLKIVKKYLIAYGLNPDKKPKLHRGDNRTPEGVYRINEILSMDADSGTESYRKLRRMNAVYFRARDGHSKYGSPREDLGDNAYGPRFYLLDYPNDRDRRRHSEALQKGELPMQGGGPAPIGHGIALHGNNDQESVGGLATSGCVRMYNNDIIELERYIMLGTPVIISGP